MKGIDVSQHNGAIDWPKVKKAGLSFAIVRAGYGRFRNQTDKLFAQNAQGALDAGLHLGVYWFSYALTPDEAREEAALCSEVLGPYRGRLEFPVYFDYEYDSERYAKEHDVSPDRELRTQLICAFCAELERRGWRAGVYTNNDYLKNRVDASRLSPWELWLADYSGGPDAACGMQQTGSTGTVDGVSGKVDTDESFLDYPALVREHGWNGFAAQATGSPDWVSDTTNGPENPVCIPQNKSLHGEDHRGGHRPGVRRERRGAGGLRPDALPPGEQCDALARRACRERRAGGRESIRHRAADRIFVASD